MTCPTCGAEPCINPSFCRTCREADARHHRRDPNAERRRRLLADSISIDRAYAEINKLKGRAANSTVEALAFQLRSGVGVLKEASVRRRLSELSDEQLVEIGARVQRHKPEIAPVWSDDDVDTLMQLRVALR
jgi:hypothetical protein